MKDFYALPLEDAPEYVKELAHKIQDTSNYISCINAGMYPGNQLHTILMLKQFLNDIRDQLITAYDKHEWVINKKQEELK